MNTGRTLAAAQLVAVMVMSGCSGTQEGAVIPELGTAAPEIALPDPSGRPITIGSLTREGPAVIFFHRGHW